MKVELSLHEIANLMLACSTCELAVLEESGPFNKWNELHDKLEDELKKGIMKAKGGA